MNHDPNHPRHRPVEPEHPMVLEGAMMQGDPALLLRCLYEEFLRSGVSADQLRKMVLDPQYQALYSARLAVGADKADALLDRIARTVGRIRITSHDRWPDDGASLPW